eukprot:CAMPEP_0170175206 /NCGR_PEP_ID=MMETSP0040_2-20121228/8331_1 /TAXON_ID=641309 /ORGANISM="Lotharella oceanica, Strain CCMP622" /LENGTH=276 /DNA_ID=CAMNT_0010417115 /DNA_START=34 /DNA_END=864 /DNA_ORIENTATION=-
MLPQQSLSLAAKQIDAMTADIQKNAHMCSQASSTEVKAAYVGKMDQSFARLRSYLISTPALPNQPIHTRRPEKSIMSMDYSMQNTHGMRTSSYAGQYYYGRQPMHTQMNSVQVSRPNHPAPIARTSVFTRNTPSSYMEGSHHGMAHPNPIMSRSIPMQLTHPKEYKHHMATQGLGIRRQQPAPAAATIPCPYCRRLFKRKSNLNQHIRTHTNEKPYTCKNCQRRFAHSSNRNSHQRKCTAKAAAVGPTTAVPPPVGPAPEINKGQAAGAVQMLSSA